MSVSSFVCLFFPAWFSFRNQRVLFLDSLSPITIKCSPWYIFGKGCRSRKIIRRDKRIRGLSRTLDQGLGEGGGV